MLLNIVKAARYLSLGTGLFADYVTDGIVPRPIMLGSVHTGRLTEIDNVKVRWSQAALDQWIAERCPKVAELDDDESRRFCNLLQREYPE